MKKLYIYNLITVIELVSCANTTVFAQEVPFWKASVPDKSAYIGFDHLKYPSLKNRTHFGVDIWGDKDTPIRAAFDGIVEATTKSLIVPGTTRSETLGYAILVRYPEKGINGGDLCQVALHFSKPTALKAGNKVEQGQILGLMGKTGNAGGVIHTHMELRNFCPNVRGERAGFFHSNLNGIYSKLNEDVSSTTWAKTDWEDPETFMVDVPGDIPVDTATTVPEELQAVLDWRVAASMPNDYLTVISPDGYAVRVLSASEGGNVPYSELAYAQDSDGQATQNSYYYSTGYHTFEGYIFRHVENARNSDNLVEGYTVGTQPHTGTLPYYGLIPAPTIYTCRYPDGSPNRKYRPDAWCRKMIRIVYSHDGVIWNRAGELAQ